MRSIQHHFSMNQCTCYHNYLIFQQTLSSFFENKTGLKQGDSLSSILFNLALQKVIQSIQLVTNGIKIGKEQLNILAYADDIVLIGKN
jgi:hypothetical protein